MPERGKLHVNARPDSIQVSAAELWVEELHAHTQQPEAGWAAMKAHAPHSSACNQSGWGILLFSFICVLLWSG